ncbi:MAG: hypothetical protein METHAR1v1_1750004 [Methanothrix sp.]|nr:MAG: hypothetical protein METHAR1v1_1750004 [Methanothrix sp.]
MKKIFAVINGHILENFGTNTSPTYTRINQLLTEMNKLDDIEIISIQFKQFSQCLAHGEPRNELLRTYINFFSVIYNNIVKTIVLAKSIFILIKIKPLVYFAYPHSITTIQNRLVFKFCKLFKFSIILDIHDTIEQATAISNGISAINSRIEDYSLRNSTLLLPLNGQMRNYIRNIYNLSDKLIVPVPNAFEDELIEKFPDLYEYVSGRFNVCYIGGLGKNRGVDLLVKACANLHKKYEYLNLYLFGPYEFGLQNRTRELIEESDFIIRKLVPRIDLPDALHSIDLFVMPYNPDEEYMKFVSPTKLFEYIGTGKPILCTKCESLLEIGKDGSIMYVDYDVDDIERKIELLINCPQIRVNMSKGLFKMRSQHTWKTRAITVHDAIMSL